MGGVQRSPTEPLVKRAFIRLCSSQTYILHPSRAIRKPPGNRSGNKAERRLTRERRQKEGKGGGEGEGRRGRVKVDKN